MAWTTNPYCALADVKTAMNVTTTTDDAWITELISEAQGSIDQYIGYSFQQDVGTSRVYDGNDNGVLWIDDCQSITQVLETLFNPYIGANGAFVLGTPQTMDITADCILQPNNAQSQTDTRSFYLVRRLTALPFAFGHQNYQFTGTWGFPSIPLPITRAAKLLAIHYYKRRDAAYGMMTSAKQYGQKKYSNDEDIPYEVCCILDKYKRRLFLSRNR